MAFFVFPKLIQLWTMMLMTGWLPASKHKIIMLYKIGDHIQDKYVLINISITESKQGNDSI